MTKYLSSFLMVLTVTLIATLTTHAQVVQWSPYFFTENDTVVIKYDPAKGSAGLVNVFPVYIHTGVITDKSTSASDWKYVKTTWGTTTPIATMNFVNGLWEYKIAAPRSFYGVPAGEKILRLAFVFRNGTGSLTGKNADGSDIFVDLPVAGLNVAIAKPAEDEFIPGNSQVDVAVYTTSESTQLSLYVNGSLVSTTNADTIQTKVQVTTLGRTYFVAESKDANNVIKYDSSSVFVGKPVEIAALPNGVRDGVNYTSSTEVTLVLFAPEKQFIYLLGDFNDWKVENDYAMKKTPDGLKWWITLTGLTAGSEYAYQFLIDNKLKVADPYAHKILDPWNDQYINQGVTRYPNLKPYPTGKTSGIVSVLSPGATPYVWKNTSFSRPKSTDIVTYELLIRDFTTQRTFQALIDTLGYLKNLGINVLQLMPVMEFEGNESWGYNTSFHFAVDKYYGPINKLKELIDKAHGMGIAVVLDMVLNHVYGQNPMVQMYWDGSKPAANSPWFNQTSPNPVFSYGYDFNHAKTETQYYVDRVNEFWLTEFKVDGFRFDFTKGFTNTPGDGGGYDQSRIDFLKRMNTQIKSVDPNAFVILEHFAPDGEEQQLTAAGMFTWGNLNYNFNEATMGYNANSDISRLSYKTHGFSSPRLVGYMESHDEERLMYKNLQYGNASGNYSTKNINIALQRMKMAAAFLLSVPGPKMIFQFGELGFDYSINYPCGTSECRLNNKPPFWAAQSIETRLNLYKAYSAMIKLRTQYDAFESTNFTLNGSGNVKSLYINYSGMNVAVVGNFDVVSRDFTINFPSAGTWYNFFKGDSIVTSTTAYPITLQPGEFHILTSAKTFAVDPQIGLGIENITKQKELPTEFMLAQNYPNPFNPSTVIEFGLPKESDVSLAVYNVLGEQVAQLHNGYLQAGNYSFTFDAKDLTSGVYFYTLRAGSVVQSRKMNLLK